MFIFVKLAQKYHERVAKRIKKDLISAFQSKGISIAKIKIGKKEGNTNIELLVSENYKDAV